MLRRALVVCLLALLPFQFVWAAAAGYCQHETGAAAGHFGHHVHAHKAGKPAGEGKQAGGIQQPHADCAVCQFVGSPLPPAVPGVAGAAPQAMPSSSDAPPPPSAPADTPERPNWLLAA